MEVKYDAGRFLASCFHPHNRSLITDILSTLLNEGTKHSPFWPETASASDYLQFRRRSLRTQVRLVDFWVHMIEEHQDFDCGIDCIQSETRRERTYRLALQTSQAKLCEAVSALTRISDLEVRRTKSSVERHLEDCAMQGDILQVLTAILCGPPSACEKTLLDDSSEGGE